MLPGEFDDFDEINFGLIFYKKQQKKKGGYKCAIARRKQIKLSWKKPIGAILNSSF